MQETWETRIGQTKEAWIGRSLTMVVLVVVQSRHNGTDVLLWRCKLIRGAVVVVVVLIRLLAGCFQHMLPRMK
jgi:uncharacterized membrane protein